MAYTSWSVVFGEQPTAAKWNILGTNDASFNDGTGIGAVLTNANLGTDAGELGGAWQDWTPTFTGFSSDPASPKARYKIIGKTCFMQVETGSGTSNSTSFTMTAPVVRSTSDIRPFIRIVATDGGSSSSTLDYAILASSGSNIISLRKSGSDTGWTNSGNKAVFFEGFYEID